MAQNLSDKMKNTAQVVERAMEEHLTVAENAPAALKKLFNAMRHGALNGGKRLRPFLLCEAARMCRGVEGEAEAGPAAAAIEMVHSYSLVHDDLPAMDDADTRRGEPSVHVAFDEAIGILAGDGLLTDAFGVLTAPGVYPPDIAVALVGELSRGAGALGMVGGQMMDLYPGSLDEEEIVGIQRRKTGALIEAAAVMGGIVGRAGNAELDALRAYAAALGEAFQIVDDILDVTATSEDLGKPAGADEDAGKATFVSALGLEGARARVDDLTERAIAALTPFGDRAETLNALAEYQRARGH